MSSTNPFHRLGAAGQTGQSPLAAATRPKGANNPFFRPPTGAATAVNPLPLAEAVPRKVQVARKEDDWGDDQKSKQADSDDSDDDDDEGPSVKQMRAGLAGLLFGGAPASPSSAAPSRPSSTKPDSAPSSAAPKAPAATLPPL